MSMWLTANFQHCAVSHSLYCLQVPSASFSALNQCLPECGSLGVHCYPTSAVQRLRTQSPQQQRLGQPRSWLTTNLHLRSPGHTAPAAHKFIFMLARLKGKNVNS